MKYTPAAKNRQLEIHFTNCVILALGIVIVTAPLSVATATPEAYVARHRQLYEPQITFSPALSLDLEARGVGTASSLSGALVADTRVSDIIGVGNFDQRSSAICRLDDGTFVAVWEDNREGAYKIFGQRLSSAGALVGANIKLAERTDGYDLSDPEVAPTVSGKFYLGWRDGAAGQIRVARFTSALALDLADFEASDPTGGAFAGAYSIDAQPNGRLIVAYEEYDVGNLIRVRRFQGNGAVIGSTITVNSDGGAVAHWYPQVALEAPNFDFAVVWEDYRSGNADLYLRRFDSSGAPFAGEVTLIDASAASSAQYAPELIFSPLSGFVAGWSDTRSGNGAYIQRYNKNIGLVGANVRISSSDTTLVAGDIALATDPSDRFVALYSLQGATSQALIQRFDLASAMAGAPAQCNGDVAGILTGLALAVGLDNTFLPSWIASSAAISDAFSRALDSVGAPKQGSVTLNNEPGGGPSDQPDIAIVSGRTVATVFRGAAHDDRNIYLQLANLEGGLVGANQKVNQDTVGAAQWEPVIAGNASAGLIAWLDEREISGVGGTRVYSRRAKTSGGFFNSETLLSGAVISAKSELVAALSASGQGLVCWIDYRALPPQVYGQYVNATGAVDGAEVKFSNSAQDLDVSSLAVAVDSSSRFRVVWLDRGAVGGSRVRTVLHSRAGGVLGTFDLLSDQSGVSLEDIDLASGKAGEVYLLWQGRDGANLRRLYLSTRNSIGGVLATTLEIPTTLLADPLGPSISIDEQGFVATAWIDSRTPERRAYYRIYTPALVATGGDQPVSLAGLPAMFSASVSASAGRTWFAWADARSLGMNVYINGFVHSPTATTGDDDPIIPTQFILGQNYPNPFNPTTSIEFSLVNAGYTTLEVFDITGRKVRELVSSQLTAGAHRVVWDGRDATGLTVASGVYFYRLSAQGAALSRKMTLLK